MDEKGEEKSEEAALAQLHREDETISQRIDWSLIFHAILLEAFFAAKGNQQLPVAMFGLTTSWLWFVSGVRQHWNRHAIVLDLESIASPKSPALIYHQRLASQRHAERHKGQKGQQPFPWAVAVPLFTMVIPATCLIAWLWLATLICALTFVGRLLFVGTVVGLTTYVARRVWANQHTRAVKRTNPFAEATDEAAP